MDRGERGGVMTRAEGEELILRQSHRARGWWECPASLRGARPEELDSLERLVPMGVADALTLYRVRFQADLVRAHPCGAEEALAALERLPAGAVIGRIQLFCLRTGRFF